MAFTPENSAIRTNAELNEAINKATSAAEISEILKRAAIEQQLCVPDRFDSSFLHATELASAAPKRFAKTVVIDGVKKTVESDSPESLAQAELDLLRQTYGQGDNDTAREQARDANGRFTADQGRADEADAQAREKAALEAATKADLELKFKRGDITADEYLAQSGAIDAYLESKGVSMSAMRDASLKSYEASWKNATETFVANNPDWPGGQANMKVIGEIIQQSGLADNPSAETLQRAFEHAKQNNLLTENEDTALESKIASAKSHSEISALLGRGATTSGGFFGGR